MSKLFEISGDDIAQLNDSELRELIGLLCEADYRRANRSAKRITWGGDQDATDGGLDVVVRDDVKPPENSFIPRSNTGFQVKKSDMPRSKIIPEMRPKAELRESIRDLIVNKGAYIIVSSSAKTSDSAYKNRLKAMKEAISPEQNHQNLELDFYDRNRIATWVREHPFMILWVRNKIGRQLNGWRPYENWSNPKADIDEEFFVDDRFRIHGGIGKQDKGQTVEAGIQSLRSELSAPGASVRIAGLSGVGKTRLSQALFDDRIGKKALNRSLAFYTDITDNPAPDPKTFAEQLISSKTRAILIVDNCPPELHKLLTKTISAPESTISLLTVEYDVREDLPDETIVFRLEPSSEDIIEKIIANRFEHINQVDARTIAKFSGGNARIAISLANTLRQGESLSDLKDEDLFKRLFQQRHDSNESLLISAQACSLVYSFEGTDAVSKESELKFLASIVGKTANELYRDITTLRNRDLVQTRGRWKAVLPPAISNRLAKHAFESIPKEGIAEIFINNGTERLIKSFARRLGYLHDCEQAVEIVNEWLSPNGYLGGANCGFNDFGMAVFRNVAPVSPEKTLEMIERAANGENGNHFISKENRHSGEYVKLLRSLAYDASLFDRCIELLCRFALLEDLNEDNNSVLDAIKAFFYTHLSGTHATIEQRVSVISELVNSEDDKKQMLGLLFLDATLETWNISSFQDFTFGARPRDFGYHPKTREEYANWFETFIGVCGEIALSKKTIAKKAQKIISDKMRGLWINAQMHDVLEKFVIQIRKQQPWNEGWIAVRGIIKYDKKGMNQDVLKRLCKLEKYLKPDDLLEKARVYALSSSTTAFPLEDIYEDDDDGKYERWEKVENKTIEIGTEVSKNKKVLNVILPDLFTPQNSRVWSFGKGLAIGCSDKKKLWVILRSQYEKTNPEKRHIRVLSGFLSGIAEADFGLYNSILDDLIEDELLGEWFPWFQTTAKIDSKGVERLNKALTKYAKVEYYNVLGLGRAHEPIRDDDFARLLMNILSNDGGMSVAVELLNMRFYKSKDEAPNYSKNLLDVGRHVLINYNYIKDYRRHNGQDYDLSQIARVCLAGKSGINAAIELCQNFIKAMLEESGSLIPDYPQLFSKVAEHQPIVLLDFFIGDDRVVNYTRGRIFRVINENRDSPLNYISDNDVIAWCEIDSKKRYANISIAIQAFRKTEKNGKLEWRTIVKPILENASDVSTVFDNLIAKFTPGSWSGSLADIMQERAELLKEWFVHDNEEIRSLAKIKYAEFQEAIKSQREREKRDNRDYRSFE